MEGSAAGAASLVEYFEQQTNHRRLQHEEQCRGSGMQTMLATCCPSDVGGGGHRRELQGSGRGCTAFPDTCSAAYAGVFAEFYEARTWLRISGWGQGETLFTGTVFDSAAAGGEPGREEGPPPDGGAGRWGSVGSVGSGVGW
eukprot:SAG22_NODE_6_length_41368_cov_49.702222_27_plen_142_part_00